MQPFWRAEQHCLLISPMCIDRGDDCFKAQPVSTCTVQALPRYDSLCVSVCLFSQQIMISFLLCKVENWPPLWTRGQHYGHDRRREGGWGGEGGDRVKQRSTVQSENAKVVTRVGIAVQHVVTEMECNGPMQQTVMGAFQPTFCRFKKSASELHASRVSKVGRKAPMTVFGSVAPTTYPAYSGKEAEDMV